MSKVTLLRVLRVARLVRLVRFVGQFRSLWLLIKGLYHSLTMLLWTTITLFGLSYILAVMGMELVEYDMNSGDPFDVLARESFGTLEDALLTLLQVVCLDSISSIYRPLIDGQPILSLYFIGSILVLAVCMMNLITGIMVDTAMKMSLDDREENMIMQHAERQKFVGQLRKVFNELDKNSNGMLDFDEVSKAPKHLQDQLHDVCKMDNIEELFKALDDDESGLVGIEEFCDGILKVSDGKPMELFCILRSCHHVMKELKDASGLLRELRDKQAQAALRDCRERSALEVMRSERERGFKEAQEMMREARERALLGERPAESCRADDPATPPSTSTII